MECIYDCRDLIKDKLKNSKDEVVKVLEKLGCHHINSNFGETEIRCALPNGDNVTSVSVLLCDNMTTTIFTKNITGDIFSLVRYVLNCNFDSSLRWLCGVLDIEFNGEYIEVKKHPTIVAIEEAIRRNKPREEITHEILNPSFLKMFKKGYVQEWVDEEISIEIQEKYGICIDEKDMRWVIPIYDENNNLITCKGRTYLPNYEIMGEVKYWHYKRLGRGKNDILFGLNFHKEIIKEKREVILFEGEKSVMKAEGYGFDWAVSVGKNGINPNLVRKILALHCNVVIAFDKGIERNKIIKEAKKLTMFTNVDIIFDYENLLEDKDAPVDKGKEVWEVLYNNKQRVR